MSTHSPTHRRAGRANVSPSLNLAQSGTMSLPPYQLLPPLDEASFLELKNDIARRGVMVPIERDENGALLDGHHRMRAVEELAAEGVAHLDPPVILRLDFTESQKRSHVRALNIQRRMLSAKQRRVLIEDELRETPERSDRSIAAAFSVSPSTVSMVRRKLGDTSPTVHIGQSKRLGKDGRRRSLPQPRSVIATNALEARRALAALKDLPQGVLPDKLLSVGDTVAAARLVRQEATREGRMARLRDPGPLSRLGDAPFALIYADPPWQYEGASDPTRTADRHYPTLSHDDLLLLPVGEIAAERSMLFMWATPPKIAEAVELMAAWGFTYKTSACWDKGGENGTHQGMGSYYRQQHELLLVGTRGDPPPPAPSNRPPSILRQPRMSHSAKPDLARKQIEAMFGNDIRRIELFARGPVPGWTVWGYEAETEIAQESRREA